MRIKKDLLVALVGKVIGLVATKPIVPIRENILIDALDRLTFQAENEVSGIRASSDFVVPKDERFYLAVPARLLADTVRLLQDEEVELIGNQELKRLEIKSANGHFKITCEPGGDFPKFPTLPEAFTEVQAPSLCGLIRPVLSCVSTDDLRFAMNGVHIKTVGNDVVGYATDGYRVARLQDASLNGMPTGITIHRAGCRHILDALQDAKTVSVGHDGYKIYFQTDDTSLYATLIKEAFPECEPFFADAAKPTMVTVNKGSLEGSLNRAKIFVKYPVPAVKLELAGQTMKITGKDEDFAQSFNEDLTVEHSGPDLTIAFNAALLAESCRAFQQDTLSLGVSAPEKAAILKSPDPRLQIIIMPIRLD